MTQRKDTGKTFIVEELSEGCHGKESPKNSEWEMTRNRLRYTQYAELCNARRASTVRIIPGEIFTEK